MPSIIANHSIPNRATLTEDSTESKLLTLPDEKDREFDVELGMLMLNGYVRYYTFHLGGFDFSASGSGKSDG